MDLLRLTTDEKKVRSLSLCDPVDCSLAGSSIQPWDFPGKSTGVGCHFPLQDAINLYILVCLTFILQNFTDGNCLSGYKFLPVNHILQSSAVLG